MWHFLTHLFDTTDFVPRSLCGEWSTGLRLVHMISDLGTWSAYVAIPFVLAYFLIRRRDIPFRWMLGLFGLFILACGTVHLVEAGMFYWPLYRLSALVKVVTVVASWATVVALVPLVPKVLSLRSPAELEREIAERKRAEAALRASEATFRSAFEYAAVGMALVGPDGKFHRVNQSLCNIVGYSEEELLGKAFPDITHPDDIAIDKDHLRRLLEGEIAFYHLEKRYLHKNGQTVWVMLSRSALHGAPGEPTSFVSQVQNITARKRSEAAQAEHARELDEKNQQLVAAERWKSDFFSQVSHELRTPLTLILAPLETLLAGDQGPLEPSMRALLTTTHGNAVRLLQMVNGLLDLSRLQAEQAEIHREPVAIGPLTAAILRDFQPLIDQRRLASHLSTALASEAVAMDRYLYERILFNLLSNAVKFTPAGGRVDVSLTTGNERLQLVVRDSGQGIAAADLASLFQKYKQLGGGAARRFEGTGLGLALVKEFTELLSGQVTVESSLGNGSSFVVDLAAPSCPIDQVHEDLAQQRPAPPIALFPAVELANFEAPSAKAHAGDDLPRVLIAEDNAELAAYTQSLLSDFCLTEVVGDGEQALSRARQWRPALVISDVMMPARDGLSLCRELKSDPATAATPVVLLTAMTHRDALLKGWESGADEYLFKPFHPRELVTRIRTLLVSTAARRRADQLEIDRHSLMESLEQRLRVEENLHAATVAAESANRAKSEFLANMSHEIRTPLAAILALNDLMLSTELNREQREYLQTTKTSADALLRLVNDILDFSKIEAGKMDLESGDFSLRKCLQDTFKSLEVQADQKGLALTYAVESDIPDAVLGDPGRLRQVLVNLVGNAVKFTEQGQVAVRITRETFDDDAMLLQFEVRDTGIGIPLEQQAVIFEAFRQGDTSASRRFGGTGLGLTIAARLVELMGGRIWLESTPGTGCAFHFTARLALQRAPLTRAALETAVERVAGRSALVVDDSPANREILGKMLTNWRIRCKQLEAAEPALEELRRAAAAGEAYDFVLLDAVMPSVDGFELARRITSGDIGQRPRLVMLSSANRAVSGEECQELGLASYLMKPVSQSDLLDALVSGSDGATGQRTQMAGPARSAAGTAHPLRILLAEDTPANQLVARRVLEKQGHQVIVANDGDEAIQSWRRQSFDLILMDVQMPNKDGLAATREIRAEEQATGQPAVYIVALTAHALKGDRERCLHAGMDGYLAKPIDAQCLLDMLASRPAPRVAAPEPTPSPEPAERADLFEVARAMKERRENDAALRPESSSSAAFDRDAMLARLDGDVELLEKLVGFFRQDVPEYLGKVRQGMIDRQGSAVGFAAHRLAGILRNFFAHQDAELALRLESLGEAGQFEEVAVLLPILEQALRRLSDAIDTACPKT